MNTWESILPHKLGATFCRLHVALSTHTQNSLVSSRVGGVSDVPILERVMHDAQSLAGSVTGRADSWCFCLEPTRCVSLLFVTYMRKSESHKIFPVKNVHIPSGSGTGLTTYR